MNRLKNSHSRLPWILCGFALLLYAGALVLLVLNRNQPRPALYGPTLSSVIDLLTSIVLPVVGAIIATHRPRNPIGWLLLLGALASSLGVFAGEWAFMALLVETGSLPAGGLASVLVQTTWTFNLTVLPLVVLLFPKGTLPSRRWRVVAGLAAAPAAVAFPALFASAWSERGAGLLLEEGSSGVVDYLILGSIACALLTIGASIVALSLRYVRGDGILRSQIKWLMTATVVLLVDGITSTLLPTDAVWRQVLSSLAFYLIPVSMGIAILRYRLYQIDRIINRALVYGALTLLLAGCYGLGVLALQSVLPAAEGSPLVVASTTLAIVALFRPLKTRVQTFIDRSFYRTRYDAERTVADFGVRLRQQVDLDALASDLVEVVESTLHPTKVSLWLKASGGSR